MGHFVSNLPDNHRPETIYHHYVTNSCVDENSIKCINNIAHNNFKLDKINFKPYSIYKNINIKPLIF